MKGVVLREGISGASACVNSPSCPPPREELHSVINHFLVEGSHLHTGSAAVGTRVGVPALGRGQTGKRQRRVRGTCPDSGRQTHTHIVTQSHNKHS